MWPQPIPWKSCRSLAWIRSRSRTNTSKNLFTKDVTYLITTLNSDRLLAGFKAVSTGTTATNLYGGWENQNIRGHSMGHWLSAVAHAYQQAKGSDPALASQIKVKLDDVVSKLKSYQSSSGFLFATPISQFDDMDSGGSNNWVPYYTMHKILAGLLDVYEFEQNPDALAVASKMGDWLYSRATGWNASAKSRVLSSEYGGMNDALYELYKHTKVANHLTVAHIFDDTNLFTTTAQGNDTLSGKHANMTIPKFIGALNRYRTIGTTEAILPDRGRPVHGARAQEPHLRHRRQQPRRALPRARKARRATRCSEQRDLQRVQHVEAHARSVQGHR